MVPHELTSERLVLRAWRRVDAALLAPVLAEEYEHLEPWIPATVSTPAPVEALQLRLAGYAADFAADRAWRWALYDDTGALLGEIGLHPRTQEARVPYDEADRVEVGYWLRASATGRGLATEATRAALDVAARLVRFGHAEIRCDARNAASAAIPQRLGFTLAETLEENEGALQVWRRDL